MDITITKGSTFSQVLRWTDGTLTYRPITAITQAAPVSITSPAHGIPNGTPAAVSSVKGMTQINPDLGTPKDRDYWPITVVDANTITINGINSAGFSAYTSGGYIQYKTPYDLTGFTARMSIKAKIGGTELLRLDTTNGRIAVNNTTKTITLTIDATTTAAITWAAGIYDLEMVSPTGVVTAIYSGAVLVIPEVTTT